MISGRISLGQSVAPRHFLASWAGEELFGRQQRGFMEGAAQPCTTVDTGLLCSVLTTGAL